MTNIHVRLRVSIYHVTIIILLLLLLLLLLYFKLMYFIIAYFRYKSYKEFDVSIYLFEIFFFHQKL